MILTIETAFGRTKSFLKPRIIDQVIAVALSSDGPRKIGAILLKKNKLITAATNNYTKSDPFQAKISEEAALIYNKPELSKKVFGHAETLALKKIKNNDADTIVVCRLSGKYNSRALRLGRPCEICTHLIIKHYPSIKHIHYSTDRGFMYEYWG
jgi:deoxycytidylate deaminase